MNIESARLSTPSSFERRTSLLVGILGVAGSFAFAGATTDFVVTPVSSTVVDLTPGVVVITTIQLLGTLSELVAFIVALLATVMILSGAALVGNQIGSRTGDWFGVMLGVYFTGWCVAALITRSPVPALAVAIPMGITAGLRERSHGRDTQTSVDDRRRRALKTVAALLGQSGSELYSASVTDRSTPHPLSAIPSSERETIERRPGHARQQSLDIDGIPGLVSSVSEFYEVDINTINPDISASEWSLSITGAVENEQTVNYTDLTAMEPVHQFITLRCVGICSTANSMDTAL